MQQTPSKLKIFRESCIFFALATLLPLIGIWFFSIVYQYQNPGDGIGQGLSLLIVLPLSFISSLALGLGALRWLQTLKTMKWAVFIPILLAYISYFLVPKYYPYLSSLGESAAWFVGVLLVPALITTTTATMRKWTRIGVATAEAITIIALAIAGAHVLDAKRDNHFATVVDSLGYTLYLFPDTPNQPFINNVDLDKHETKIDIFSGLASHETTPDIDYIYEKPLPKDLPSESCGPNYQPVEVAAEKANGLKCQRLATVDNGDIYKMTYQYPNRESLNLARSEYFMITPTTVVHATYRNHSNNLPIVSDEQKSINFLKDLIPVTGAQLRSRLNAQKAR